MVKKVFGRHRPMWTKILGFVLSIIGVLEYIDLTSFWSVIHPVVVELGIPIPDKWLKGIPLLIIALTFIIGKIKPKISEDVNDDENRDLDNSY
jgi:hypothetical protein